MSTSPFPPTSAASSATQGEPVFDEATALECVGRHRDILLEMIDLFVDEGLRLLTELTQAITRGDASATRRFAHTLKGTVAHFGAQPASRAAEAIEFSAKSGELHRAGALLAITRHEVDRLLAALLDWRDRNR